MKIILIGFIPKSIIQSERWENGRGYRVLRDAFYCAWTGIEESGDCGGEKMVLWTNGSVLLWNSAMPHG